MFLYFCIGFVSFFVLWFIFANMMQLKPYISKIKDIPVIYQIVVLIYGLGFLGDILWNIIFASPLFYVLDRYSGNDHKNSQFLPIFKGVTLKTLYKLTLTARLDYTITEISHIWDASYILSKFICLKLLNPFDPKHCGITNILAYFHATKI